MSSLRLFCASRLARGGSKGNFGSPLLCRCRGRARWQSTNMPPPRGGSGASRIITYVTAGSIVAFGGGLVYANYDPVFKLKVDQYVPGFTKLADSAADSYVALVDSVGLGKKKSEDKEMRPGLGQEGRRRSFRPHPAIGERGKEEVSTPQTAEKETKKSREKPPTPHAKKEAPLTPPPESGGGGAVTQEREGEEETDKSLTPSSQTASHSSSPPPPVAKGGEEGGKKEQVSAEGEIVEEEKEAEEREEKDKDEGNSAEFEVPSKSDEPSSVESSVAAARKEAARVAGEVMEESLREHKEAQMSEEHLGWLRDSAQVGTKLDESFLKFHSLTTSVLEAQRSVVEATREQSRLVREATSSPPSTTESDDTQSMGHIADALASTEESAAASRRALEEATRQHEEHSKELGELMDRAVELGLKSKVEEIKRDEEEQVAQLVNGSSSVKEAEAEGEVLQLYHRQAEKKREELQRELGTELPKGNSRQEALLLMLSRRVDVLRKRLEEVEREHSKELSTALGRQKERLDELDEQRLMWSLQVKEREAGQELEYMVEKMEKEYQSDLREQLRIQTDTHTSHLAGALHSQADQLAVKWSEELELRLLEQGGYYQGQLVQTMARLRGIEYMINTIAHAGSETKRQQGLRAACDSLYCAVQSASISPSPIQRYSFTQEVCNLREVAKDDPFIVAMLDSLPTVATGGGGGILCEGGLKERFVKVKRVCRRVALVPETGGGLGRYALSYLQSLLVVSWRLVGRGARGGEDPDPHKMDTFKVLECADDALSRGDLEQAVRCVNLLRGEPRRVAQDWLHDARHYLETSQAILLISQYLAALNISASPQ